MPVSGRDRHREREHPPVERNRVDVRQTIRQHQPRHAARGDGQQESEDRSEERQQHALGQQKAHQPSPARPERRADRQLPVTCGRARQQQVRNVRARDQENESDRPHREPQPLAHVSGESFVQQSDAEPQSIDLRLREFRFAVVEQTRGRLLVEPEQLLARRRVPGCQVRAGQSRSTAWPGPATRMTSGWVSSWSDAADSAPVAGNRNVAGVTPTTVRTAPLTVTVRPTIDGITAEARDPEIVAQQRNGGRAAGCIGFREVASGLRGHAEQRQEVPGDERRLHLLGLAAGDQRRRSRAVESAKIAQRFRTVTPCPRQP